ncbi:MAG TPA: hypothetical protein VGX28_13540 [Frankiaceae bacterium]|jgi:hypothetical protein|nr:hypothetical protein [Frankiaceae bacterium]
MDDIKSALAQTGVGDDDVQSLAGKIRDFESSLSPDEATAWHTAMSGATSQGIDSMFGDPSKRAELESYLRDTAGVEPTQDQPGSITSVVVTVAVHC